MELLGDDGFMLEIRGARISDIPAITGIYNEAILETVATFDTESKSATEQESWFSEHGEVYPILVAERSGSVVGWVSLNRWSDSKTYGFTAKMSLYIGKSHRGRGYGRRLLEAVLTEARCREFHIILARVADDNAKVLHLLESFEFEAIGIMNGAGYKFGRFIDVHQLQKIL